VTDHTPAAQAGLLKGDEIRAIDGRQTPALGLEEARELFRTPGERQLEVLRDGRHLRLRLAISRLV
jgi:C-terminal processing protease CtpA/Prc